MLPNRRSPHPAWMVLPVLAAISGGAMAQQAREGRWFREIPDILDTRPNGGCQKGVQAGVSGRNVNVQLNVAYADYEIYNPTTDRNDKVHLRSYNGCPNGPVIRIDPGSRLRVDLRNNLPATEPTFDCPPDDGQHHRPHCFNTVNLHTHGLHVSPSGNSDNVLVSIDPGKRFQYEYDIPRNHPAGTHWYHAHRHGSTAIQVSSGGAGVLIVRGNRRVQDKARNDGVADIDTLLRNPHGRPLRDQTLLFQQIEYACFNNPTSITPLADPVTFESTCAPGQVGELRSYDTQLRFTPDPRAGHAGQFNSTWDISGRYTAINGVVQPTMPQRGERIAAGELQRWRLVHGGVRDSINLKIVKADLSALLPAGTGLSETSLDKSLEMAMLRMRGARSKLAQGLELSALCKGEVVNQLEFALDGQTRTAVSEKAVNTLHPGQRSDTLVAFPSAGLYCVLDEAADAGSTINFRPGFPSKAKDRRLLSFARVGFGPGVPNAAPDGHGHTRYWQHVRDQLVSANPDLPPQVRQDLKALKTAEYASIKDIKCPAGGCGQRKDEFTIAFDPAAGLTFGINGKPYLPGRLDFAPVLGKTDEWTVNGGAAHIFHVHVNPLQVVDVIKEIRGPGQGPTPGPLLGLESIFDKSTGKCKPEYAVPDAGAAVGEDVTQYCDQLGAIRDTVFQKAGYRIVMRTRYEDYTGKFVMHCHILDHEDEGMMMNVEIMSPARAAFNAMLEPLQIAATGVGSALERAGIVRTKAPELPADQICRSPVASNRKGLPASLIQMRSPLRGLDTGVTLLRTGL